MFLLASYQTIRYIKYFKRSARSLKVVIFTTNLLTLFMVFHYAFSGIQVKYELLYVIMEFFLYLDYLVIVIFYVRQASVHLEDSGVLIKMATYILSLIFVVILSLFIYFTIIVSLQTLDYSDCKSFEWAIVIYASLFIGCCFLMIGIKLSAKLRQKKKQGFIIQYQREKELWY